jgi:exodeoxyribonuclease VII small subunit
MSKENGSIDFEQSMKDLESVVTELDGEIKLERAIALFEQGMKLSKECEEFLKGAERKIEILKRADDGEIVTETFLTGEEKNNRAVVVLEEVTVS